MKQRNLVLGITAIALVVAISSVVLLSAPQQEKITLAINPFPLSALVHIAEENGYFEAEGISVEHVNFQTGKMAMDAMLGGGADMATTADIPITLAGLNDQEFKIVGTIAWSNEDIQVVARKDSGINSPADLRGKKIATTSGGGPLFYTHKFLEAHNIALEEVSITNMAPTDMVFAITKGEVDAIIVFSPHHINARTTLGGNAVVFAPDDLYGESWNVVVRPDFAEKNPEKVKAFLRAVAKAETFLKTNKSEAIAITSRYSNTEESVLQSYWDVINFELFLGDLLLDQLDSEAAWAIESGISSRDTIPDYRTMIDPSYLEEVKPDAVSV